MKGYVAAALAIALAGCRSESETPTPGQSNAATAEAVNISGAPSASPLPSGSTVGPSSSDPAYVGDWVPVDRSSAGFTLYVDRSSIVPISATRKRADVGYADNTGRTLVRIGFHCDEKMAEQMDGGLGQVETDLPDLVGDLPRDEPHLAARDYVCFGRRSKPELNMPTIKEIPSVAQEVGASN